MLHNSVHICSFGSIGIGDGGNELGMGKVKEVVKAKMHKGDLIACDVPADFAVTAGKDYKSICYIKRTTCVLLLSLCRAWFLASAFTTVNVLNVSLNRHQHID